MWIRKALRDIKKGVDCPMPTQVVSNEEFTPRPQTPQQKQVEHLIGEIAEQKSKTLGLAQNKVFGKVWDVHEVEPLELAAIEEKFPKGEYFVLDVQAHFSNGIALPFREMEFVKNMGFNLKNDVESYSYRN